MTNIKLAEVRAAIAACNFLEEGSTQETRQETNVKRINLYRQLDQCRSTLDKLMDTAATNGEDTGEIKGLRREVEALAGTLVLRPVQRKPWPLFKAVDFLWRAPATFFFVVFLAFVVSIPLIVLTMTERKLFFLLQGRRKGKARGERPRPGGSGSGSGSNTNINFSDSNSCSDVGGATPMPSPTNSVSSDHKLGPVDDETSAGVDADTIGRHAHGDPSAVSAVATAGTADALGFDSGGAPCGWDRGDGSGDGYWRISTLIKRFNARWLLLLMGVSVREEGLRECRPSRPAMLLFAHVSTLDAMIILGTFPRAMCAVVKEELFALPFIGWIMASHGGIPINRRHRASAVEALAETAARAKELGLFVAMAPEGTRSKTGQLGPFKKGALHLQEQLQWPVIPVTIHGAYELFPLKTYFNECGRVVVRFHSPIEAADIKSRDKLAQRLRQEMLDAVEVKTLEAGSALGLSRRAVSTAATALTYWLAGDAVRALTIFCFREGVAVWALIAGFSAYTAISTLFVYFVYARKCFSGRPQATDGNGSAVMKGKEVVEATPEVDPLLGAGEGAKVAAYKESAK